MKIIRTKYLVLVLILALVPAVFGIVAWAVDFNSVLEANIIDVVRDNVPEKLVEPSNSWDLFKKIDEAFKGLADIELSIGSKKIGYYENRTTVSSDGKMSISSIKLSEEEKEIALAIFNNKNGQINIIKVIKKGDKLIVPDGFEISIGARINGIQWNYWNTIFNINKPEDSFVIALKYPVAELNRKIEYVYYSPYSSSLHRPDVIVAGSEYITQTVDKAFEELKQKSVLSRAFPNRSVAEVFDSKKDFFRRLPLLEHSDLTEFMIDPLTTAQRVITIIGTNKEKAFSPTCNSSSACGWIQFTPKTYQSMRTTYKPAGLIPDFKTGAADHKNSMMAAILLHDNNLKSLVERYGEKIVDDPKLEEYLAASYNGSPSWVWQSLNTTRNSRNPGDWTAHLRTETLGFITKLRFLIENELPYI